MDNFTGALLDTRPQEEKEKDIKFEELVGSAAPVQWVEKTSWRRFPELNQKRSSMCGAFSFAKLMGVYWWLRYGNFIRFSEEDIYQRRSPKVPGMSVPSLYKIASDGVTLKDLTNVQIETDADADSATIEQFKHDVGKVFAMGEQINVVPDIETIASIIQQTGKPVHYMLGFKVNEYSSQFPIPDGDLNVFAPSTNRHFVTLVDFGLINGKKYIRAEDSAHFGGFSERYFDARWFQKRSVAATYPMNFKFVAGTGDSDKPRHTFSRDLEYSPIVQYDEEVKWLQKCLKYEGIFPANIAEKDYGYFGSITRTAVEKFQLRYTITTAGGPGYGRVGPKTRSKLNQLYS